MARRVGGKAMQDSSAFHVFIENGQCGHYLNKKNIFNIVAGRHCLASEWLKKDLVPDFRALLLTGMDVPELACFPLNATPAKCRCPLGLRASVQSLHVNSPLKQLQVQLSVVTKR